MQVSLVAVTLIDQQRIYVKCKLGELPAVDRSKDLFSFSLYDSTPKILVVPDMSQDKRYSENPLVTGEPHLRFYASAGLYIDGKKVGVLHLIDHQPHESFTAVQVDILADIAHVMTAAQVERSRNRVLVSSDPPHITQAVLNMLRGPLFAMTERSAAALRVMKKLDRTRASLSQEDKTVGLRREGYIMNIQIFSRHVDDFDREREVFNSLLDRCLRVTGRVFSVNSSCELSPRFIPLDISRWIEDVQDASDAAGTRCAVRWDPSGSEDLRSAYNMLAFSHSDVMMLILISLLHYLNTIATVENISVMFNSTDEEVTATPSIDGLVLSGLKGQWIEGEFVVQIAYYLKPKFVPSIDRYDVMAVQQMLNWVEGSLETNNLSSCCSSPRSPRSVRSVNSYASKTSVTNSVMSRMSTKSLTLDDKRMFWIKIPGVIYRLSDTDDENTARDEQQELVSMMANQQSPVILQEEYIRSASPVRSPNSSETFSIRSVVGAVTSSLWKAVTGASAHPSFRSVSVHPLESIREAIGGGMSSRNSLRSEDSKRSHHDEESHNFAC